MNDHSVNDHSVLERERERENQKYEWCGACKKKQASVKDLSTGFDGRQFGKSRGSLRPGEVKV